MAARILILVLLAILPAACALPGTPTLTSTSEPTTPTVAPPTPTQVGETAIPFTTVDVVLYLVQPTPTFITEPEVTGGPVPDLDYKSWPSEPKLFMLTSPADVEPVAKYLPAVTGEAVRKTDFTTDIVLVLLRGLSGTSGYNTMIERIGYQDNTLTVYAQFWLPARQWYGYTEAIELPFHVVRVKRADLPVNFGSASLVIQLEPHEVTPTPPAMLPPG